MPRLRCDILAIFCVHYNFNCLSLKHGQAQHHPVLRNTRNLVLLTVGQVDVRGAGLTGVVKAVKEQTERPLEVRFIALERLRERYDPCMPGKAGRLV